MQFDKIIEEKFNIISVREFYSSETYPDKRIYISTSFRKNNNVLILKKDITCIRGDDFIKLYNLEGKRVENEEEFKKLVGEVESYKLFAD